MKNSEIKKDSFKELYSNMESSAVKDYNKSEWIPLYVNKGDSDSVDLLVYLGSAAVPIGTDIDKSWVHFLYGDCSAYSVDNIYVKSDTITFMAKDGPLADRLVLSQRFEESGLVEVHVHPDLIIALRLLKSGDAWVCPDRNDEEVIKIERNENNEICTVIIKNQYLKDYLSARNCYLAIGVYSEKSIPKERIRVEDNLVEKENYEIETRNVDDNIRVAYWSLYEITPRKSEPEDISFITEVDGTRLRISDIEKRVFENPIHYLCFNPNIITRLVKGQKNGEIEWTSKDTGVVRARGVWGLSWGLCDKGFIWIHWESLTSLPEQVLRELSSASKIPNGDPAIELYNRDMQFIFPKSTTPEKDLQDLLISINVTFKSKFKEELFVKNKDKVSSLSISRFESESKEGFLSLCLNLYKNTVDRLNKKALTSVLLSKNITIEENTGSLKLLNSLINSISPEKDNVALALFRLTDLRNKSAHNRSLDLDKELDDLEISQNMPWVKIGEELLSKIVSSLKEIEDILKK